MASIKDAASKQRHYYDLCETLWYNFKCCDLPATTQSLCTSSPSTDLITIEIYDKGSSTGSAQLKLSDLIKWKKKHPNSSGITPPPPPPSSTMSPSSSQGISLFTLTTSDLIDFITNSSTAKKLFKGRQAPSFTNYSIYLLKKASPENTALHAKHFAKYLHSSPDPKRPCFGRNDAYSCIPVEPGVPVWLYTITLDDVIAFVPKQGATTAADSSGDLKFDEQFTTLKLVIAEESCATTLRIPAELPAGALCVAMNEGEWGPHHHAVEYKHLKYYGLFYFDANQGWLLLEPDKPLVECGLLRHTVIAFKRKNVCELCYQCAVGPGSSLFENIKCVSNDFDGSVGKKKSKSKRKSKKRGDKDKSENDSDSNEEEEEEEEDVEKEGGINGDIKLETIGRGRNDNGDDDNEEDEDEDEGEDEYGGHSAKARSNLKVLISLDSSIKETEELLHLWVSDTFGVDLIDAEKKKISDKKKKKENRKKRKAKIISNPIDEDSENENEHDEEDDDDDDDDDDENDSNDEDEDETEDDEDNDDDDNSSEDEDGDDKKKKKKKKKKKTKKEKSKKSKRKSKKRKSTKRKDSEFEGIDTTPPKIFYHGNPPKGRIMEELRLSPGDVLELRKGDTALQFTVKYTPKSGIRHKHLANTQGLARGKSSAIVLASAGSSGSISAALASAQSMSPRTTILQSPLASSGDLATGGEHILEFDGEKIMIPEIPNVSLVIPTPASAALELESILAISANAGNASSNGSTNSTSNNSNNSNSNSQQESINTISGSVFVSNYQMYFQSKCGDGSSAGEGSHLIKIPHGLVQRVEKNSKDSGDSSITLDDTQRVLTIVCKDPRIFHFVMSANARRTLYDALCGCCSCGCARVFAFAYRSPFEQNGWDVYKPEAEYRRLGVSPEAATPSGWRITAANKGYAVCTTYPEVLAVPAAADDACVAKEATCRSRQRLPVLCWRDVATGAAIIRCSQPCVGLTGKVSDSDQRYLELIRQANIRNSDTLHILDSRPKANALANRARGGGYEDTNGSAYPGCILYFENIPNIHVVREGFEMMREVAQPGFDESDWYNRIAESKWLDMARTILCSVRKGVALVNGAHASVIIHCSDGWDRTAQCCTLTEICLDPYYRTIRGLEVLLEKDWISFGHKFQQRYAPGELKPSDQRSPIFPQFVFCLYQLLVQFPAAFEFDERLLITVLDELYACRFGTFLFNTDKERAEHKVREKTTSLWSYVNSNLGLFVNKGYAPETTPIVLYPDPSHRKLRLWESYLFDWMPSLK